MLLLSLKTMMQLELPHINVLSKVDLMESYGKLGEQFLVVSISCINDMKDPRIVLNATRIPFPALSLDFYTEVQDLSYLLEALNTSPSTARYASLNAALCELVEDFSLVGFYTLCIEDKDSVIHLARAIDKTNGYIFGGLEVGNESIFELANKVSGWGEEVEDIKERYLRRDDEEEEAEGVEVGGESGLVSDIMEQWGGGKEEDGDSDEDMPPLDHS